jgi:hypothetical protein
MFRKIRIAALAATLATIGAMSVATASASAAATFSVPPFPTPNFELCVYEFTHGGTCLPFTPSFSAWPIRGTITSTTSGNVATLPSGSTFTGASEIAIRSVSNIEGYELGGKFNPPVPCPNPYPTPLTPFVLYLEYPLGCFEANVDGVQIPPFTTPLVFPLGGKTQTAGLIITPVHIVESTINSVSGCGGAVSCSHLEVHLEANMEYEIVGAGFTSARCKTDNPVKLQMATDLTLIEIVAIGAKFVGSTTIPNFECITNPYNFGKSTALSNQLTADLTGPGTYNLNINPQ